MEGRGWNQIGVVNSGRDFSFYNCCYLQMALLCRGVGEEGALVRKNGAEYFKMLTKTSEKREHTTSGNLFQQA